MAQLHLGLLAYWMVNTVSHQLKKEDSHSRWREIIRTRITQKAVTTFARNNHEEAIMIRRCPEPTLQVPNFTMPSNTDMPPSQSENL